MSGLRWKCPPAGPRRLPELLAKVAADDTVIVSELSRLGRSLREVLGLIEELIHHKRCRLILVKQGLDLDPQNYRDMTHKILLTIFAMPAELERDFVSERTKKGLRARREQGIVLGKPKGVVQPSMYAADRERIRHLHALGVPLATIVDVHLKYGKYLSLKDYLAKLQWQPSRNASAQGAESEVFRYLFNNPLFCGFYLAEATKKAARPSTLHTVLPFHFSNHSGA